MSKSSEASLTWPSTSKARLIDDSASTGVQATPIVSKVPQGLVQSETSTSSPSSQLAGASTPQPAISTTTDDETSSEPPLSKKALKRRLKAERFQATKLERRAREKAAPKEKQRARRERLENGEQDTEDEEAEEVVVVGRKGARWQARRNLS